MRISVAICTWNRARSLDRTLESLAKVEVPAGVDWDILVVNNACTDETDAVIEERRHHLPIVRLYEDRLGLSNARNRAVSELRGDLVLWTDDDCEVHAGWLEAYVAASYRFPDAGFFGGPVDPCFEAQPPEWLARGWRHVCDAYALRDLGDDPLLLDEMHLLPFGANYAVRADVQRRYRYDPALGRRGDSLMGGEEVAALRRMVAEGWRGYWVPGARVEHRVPRNRMTQEYLRRYYFASGQEVAYRSRKVRRRSVLWVRALRAELRYQLRRRIAEPGVWLGDLRTASRRWGKLRGQDAERHQRRPVAD